MPVWSPFRFDEAPNRSLPLSQRVCADGANKKGQVDMRPDPIVFGLCFRYLPVLGGVGAVGTSNPSSAS